MTDTDNRSPRDGGDFPEVEFAFEASMHDEILAMVIDALNRQGYPDLTVDSLRADPAHRDAAVDILRDCRPLPVIRDLIDQIEQGRI